MAMKNTRITRILCLCWSLLFSLIGFIHELISCKQIIKYVFINNLGAIQQVKKCSNFPLLAPDS
jgi:hypothetical protein